MNSKLLPKILDGRGGARIDERTKSLGAQQRGGNGTRPALPIQIQKDDGVHRRKNSVTQRNQRMQKMALRGIGRRGGEIQGNTCRMMNLWNMLWALRLVSICTSRPARDSVAIPPIEEEEQSSAAYCHASSVQRSGKLKGEDA